MCGITGFYDPKERYNRAKMRDIAQAMADRIRHRGPDQGDVWQDDHVPIALAHRRLSILDLSPAGAQPMQSASGRYVIAYNGEVYNAPALRTQLETLGHQFRGHSDTEVILQAIEQWGLAQTLPKLNGMFAIALWDRQERHLHFARDRFGKKPLYLGWHDGALLFGSELKALRAHPDYKLRVNQDALGLYARYGSVPAPHCIDEGLYQLLPGHMISFDCSALDGAYETDLTKVMRPYWQAQEIAQQMVERANQDRSNSPSFDQALDRFDTLLGQCVADRMIADVPLGAFLSGGIDSSLIVAMMQKQSKAAGGGAVKTYTIGFDQAGFDEASYASKIAQHLGTEHHALYLSQGDVMDVVPKLAHIYDEPFADVSSAPTYLVSQFARESVSVALSGDGGDELFGGYNRHIDAPRLWHKIKTLPFPMRSALATCLSRVPSHIWDRALAFRPQAGALIGKLAHMLRQKDEMAMYEALRDQGGGALLLDDSARAITIGARHLCANTSFINDLELSHKIMLWDVLSYLPDTILTKVDRATMACSLEARAPLLDMRLYELAWSLPLSYKIQGAKGKRLMRAALQLYVPAALFERPKQGFTSPISAWLRAGLQGWAQDLLQAEHIHRYGLLNAHQVNHMWHNHCSGQNTYEAPLWKALMLQAWAREWL